MRKKPDIRLIASASQRLDQLVNTKRFRQDLYFQIATITLHIPPLRERPDDIIPLANRFLSFYNEKHKKNLVLSPGVYKNLRAYHWPGNIRELKNHIERLVILGDDTQPLLVTVPAPDDYAAEQKTIFSGTLEQQLRAFETQAIQAAIDRCGGNRTQAMRELGISRRTFYRKCAALRISGEK